MLTGDILENAAARAPDKTAVICGDEQFSYGELDARANQFANALMAADLARGHNVAIMSANQLNYLEIFFGAAKSGGVLAHLSARFSPEELAAVINRTDVEAIFVHANLLENVLAIRDQVPVLKRVIVFGGEAEVEGVEAYKDFLGDAPDTKPDVAIADSDAYCITYTGGTTGFPKGAVVSHASRVIGSVRAAREMDIEDTDIICCSSPLFHIAGLQIWMQTGILLGLTCVLMPAWDPKVFMDLCEKHGITAAFMVPTQINGIISHPEFSKEQLKTLRYMNFGASPTSEAQLRRQMEILPNVTWQEQYGQTEAGNLTVRPVAANLEKPESVGKAYSDLDLAILGADDRPLPAGEIGEVASRGTNVMMHYYKQPEETEAAFTADGWIRTGDVGFLDEDGFLFLVDRSKDMIISGGENVYPTEIEGVLYQHDAVNECAVFGIPDDHWGELPAAHIVLGVGQTVTEEELINFCADRMARHKRPRMIKFVDSLPKTAVGKIQKNAIREEYWEGRSRSI